MPRSRAALFLLLLAAGGVAALRPMSAADAPEPKAPADPDLNELLLRTLPLDDEPGVGLSEPALGERPKGELLTKLRDKLRRAYPVRSLEERLAYEAAGRKRLTKSLSLAKLDFEGEEAAPPAVYSVREVEGMLSWTNDSLLQPGSWSRAKALINIHGKKVSDFVGAEGFGVRRLQPPVRQRDWRSTRDRVAFDKTPGWSEADAGEKVTLPGAGGADDDTADFFNGESGPTLPAIGGLDAMNRAAVLQFAGPESWGMVTKRKHAAGFLGHNFLDAPAAAARVRSEPADEPEKAKPIERWSIRKLYLVGLLRQGDPAVYLTDALPAMEDVRSAKTRPVEDFEAKALKELAGGKEVVAEATTNRIRMVGAIRMASDCMKCHEGNRGDLLGAFTYELVRDPAYVKAEKK
jgi:hypothetical protein